MQCEGKDFMFPMQVDVFYPTVEQGAYGNVKKQWIKLLNFIKKMNMVKI